jgi:hypothetical protein
VREAEVVIRQATPDLAVFGPAPAQVPSEVAIDPALVQSSDSSSPQSFADPVDQSIRRELLPDIWAPSHLNDEQVVFLVGSLCDLVPTLVFTGHNAFIHQSLYSKTQPTAYQDSCTLSALYLAKTSQNIPIITRSIETKISGLVSASKTWSLADHLAAVQALTIYQAIRLFDPTLNVQATAASQNRLLERWTATLWKRSFNEVSTFKSSWDAWVFYESLRRTVLISVFLRGGWSCITRDGLCDQTPVLSKLPLNRSDELWGVDEKGFDERSVKEKGDAACLVSYAEWAAEWEGGSGDVDGLTDFHRMLLAACRGKDDPRLVPRKV